MIIPVGTDTGNHASGVLDINLNNVDISPKEKENLRKIMQEAIIFISENISLCAGDKVLWEKLQQLNRQSGWLSSTS